MRDARDLVAIVQSIILECVANPSDELRKVWDSLELLDAWNALKEGAPLTYVETDVIEGEDLVKCPDLLV